MENNTEYAKTYKFCVVSKNNFMFINHFTETTTNSSKLKYAKSICAIYKYKYKAKRGRLKDHQVWSVASISQKPTKGNPLYKNKKFFKGIKSRVNVIMSHAIFYEYCDKA